MNKTAMQELLSNLERKRAHYHPMSEAYIVASSAIHEVRNLLPTERQQIEQAFGMGYFTGQSEYDTSGLTSVEDYFNTTYKTS